MKERDTGYKGNAIRSVLRFYGPFGEKESEKKSEVKKKQKTRYCRRGGALWLCLCDRHLKRACVGGSDAVAIAHRRRPSRRTSPRRRTGAPAALDKVPQDLKRHQVRADVQS